MIASSDHSVYLRGRQRFVRSNGRLSTRRNNNSGGGGGVAEHRGRGRRLPEERICTWQRTERQLPEKVSRVAGHPSISSPFDSLRVALIFVSFHSALSPLPLRSAKLKEPRVRTCLEKFSRNQPRSENSSLGFGFRKWTSRL